MLRDELWCCLLWCVVFNGVICIVSFCRQNCSDNSVVFVLKMWWAYVMRCGAMWFAVV